jgi:hypothetical protein
VIRAIKLGQMGIWHSTSVPEPYSRSTEKKYEVHYQYGRDGRTPVYAEPFSSSTKGSRGDLPPAQWNYWRILSDLHAGVTFISVYGSDIEQYNDAEYAAAFDFTNRYAGYQTGDNATLSPGAWVALRDGSSDYLGGDYTFLMHRMAGDPSTDLSGVGPSWQRYGAWARRVPADGRMRFQVDDRFANTVSGQDMVLRVTYFDSRNPRFSVTAGGNKQTFRGSAKGIWMTIDMPLGPIDFSAESGADITLSATTDVTIHMVELVRSADAVADSKRPEPPMDVQ